MQHLRQARGFYPVAAMVDQRQMPFSPSSSQASSTQSMEEARKVKARRARVARAAHHLRQVAKAANCQSKSSSPSKKRVLEDGDPLLAGMVMTLRKPAPKVTSWSGLEVGLQRSLMLRRRTREQAAFCLALNTSFDTFAGCNTRVLTSVAWSSSVVTSCSALEEMQRVVPVGWWHFLC